MSDAPYPGPPRWVKVSGVAAIALAVFVLYVLLAGAGGPHGPAGHAAWGLWTLLGVLLLAGMALNWTGRWPGWQRTVPARSWPVLSPGMRKFVLIVHVASSVGMLGAVAGFLALSIAGLANASPQTVRASYVAMSLTAWFVIVPLMLASLASGLVQSLGTPWGLFRHHWVVVKLVLTVGATLLLLVHTQPIDHLAAVAADSGVPGADLRGMRVQLVVDAGLALLVLLATTALAVVKPRGVTRYGQRAARRADPRRTPVDA
jgi:hypothetical protein